MAYIVKDKDGHPVIFKGANVMAQDNFDDLEIKEFSDRERSFVAVANAESVDRFQDVIMVKGWELENYRKNPVVMGFHNYGSLPVGRSLEEWTRSKKGVKQLMFRPQLAAYPEPIKMYEMYRDGYLKGFSVGFLPKKSEPIKKKDEETEKESFFFHEPTRYLVQELLENSVAPVPAHPDALADIKAMVKKGQLYIPARYLQEDEGEDVELYDEYIHVKLADVEKFTELFEDQLAPGVVRVYGRQKDKTEKELLVHKYIFSREHFTEEQARDGMELFKEEKFPGDGHVDYRVDRYSGRSSVQVDSMPVLLECNLDFECKRKDLDIEIEDEEKETVTCECLDCKHTQTTTKHCPDIKCSKCGGKMRRVERPGPGKDVEEDEEECIIGQELEVGKDIEFEEDEYIEKDLVIKPYPNEHACRLESPDDFDKFARKNCYRKSDGKCIDYIFGIKAGKSKVQAMRYNKEVWTVTAARKNCKNKDGTFEPAGKIVEEIDAKGKIYVYQTSDVLEDKQKEVLEESLKQKLGEDATIIILDSGATLERENMEGVSNFTIKHEKSDEDYKKEKEVFITIIEEGFDKIADQIVERLKKTVKAVMRKEVDADEDKVIELVDEIETEKVTLEGMTREDISGMVSDSMNEGLGRLPD